MDAWQQSASAISGAAAAGATARGAAAVAGAAAAAAAGITTPRPIAAAHAVRAIARRDMWCPLGTSRRHVVRRAQCVVTQRRPKSHRRYVGADGRGKLAGCHARAGEPTFTGINGE